MSQCLMDKQCKVIVSFPLMTEWLAEFKSEKVKMLRVWDQVTQNSFSVAAQCLEWKIKMQMYADNNFQEL